MTTVLHNLKCTRRFASAFAFASASASACPSLAIQGLGKAFLCGRWTAGGANLHYAMEHFLKFYVGSKKQYSAQNKSSFAHCVCTPMLHSSISSWVVRIVCFFTTDPPSSLLTHLVIILSISPFLKFNQATCASQQITRLELNLLRSSSAMPDLAQHSSKW